MVPPRVVKCARQRKTPVVGMLLVMIASLFPRLEFTALDQRANAMNPNYAGTNWRLPVTKLDQAALDQRANSMNPNYQGTKRRLPVI